jgi:hypothetical protein
LTNVHLGLVGQKQFAKGAGVDGALCAFSGPRAATSTLGRMCRNIRTLYNFEPPASHEEVHAAAVQYVRKISGFNKPSKANEAAFHQAIDEVAAASMRLLSSLETTSTPKNREEEAAKAKARSAQRFSA